MIGVEAIVERLLETMTRDVSAVTASLLLRVGDGGYQAYCAAGRDPGGLEGVLLSADSPLVQVVSRPPPAPLTRDAMATDPRCVGRQAECSQQLNRLRARVVVPLAFSGDLLGLLLVGDKRSGRGYTGHDLALLRELAAQSAAAIGNAWALEERAELATGLEGGRNGARKQPEAWTSELVSDIAHELGTPLTSIKGYVDYLLEGIAGELSPMQRDFLERAKGSTARLMSLLRDLLDLFRIETGCLVPSSASVPVAPAIEEAVDQMRTSAAQRAIELAAGGAATAIARADPELLQRLLLSLIRRAVNRTPAGGRVSAEVDLVDSGSVVITVRDTGESIPMPAEDRLFATVEPQGAAATRDGGTRLELAIAKALVELHGGRIWARSEPGWGGAICFILPRVQRPVGDQDSGG